MGATLASAARSSTKNIARLRLWIDINAGAPLVCALQSGRATKVCLLLQQPNIDVNSRVPLVFAAQNGHEEMVRLLLEHPNIDVNEGACWPGLQEMAIMV